MGGKAERGSDPMVKGMNIFYMCVSTIRRPPIRIKPRENEGEPFQINSKLQFPAAMFGDSGTFPFGRRLVSEASRAKVRVGYVSLSL